MGQKFIESVFVVSLFIGLLVFGNFYANAKGFNKKGHNGYVVSKNEFYNILNRTEPDEVAKTFGSPDKVTTLKNPNGDQEGVVWVYEEAVSQKNEKLNANFVFVAGEFKYVTLSSS